MKKLLALLLVFLMLTLTFTGCSEGNNDVPSGNDVSSDVSSEDEADEVEVSSDEEASSEPEETIEDEPEYEEPEYDFEDEDEDFEDVPLTPEQQRLANMLLGEDEELNKDALYSEGDLSRLAKAMNKSKGGKEVTILFYGNGTNTGRLMDASNADTLYCSLLEEWWEVNIGPGKIIRAGTENLTSITACMRVDHDVLRYEPDVVFLDFAVQDGIQSMASSNALGYDNLIRRILQCKSAPAVVTLMLTGAEQQSFTMNPLNATIFASAAKEQKKVAEYYNLAVIDFEQSFWDNSVEVVEVTTKKEIPLINWETISTSNTVMNNDGHMILAGTIKYYLQIVLNKLGKISTKDCAYPTEGFFSNNKYMTGSYVSLGDIIEGKAQGYSLNLDTQALGKNEYSYTAENIDNPMTPIIKTWRHFDFIEGVRKEEWAYKEENPEYLTVTFPKAIEGDSYFLFSTTKSVGGRAPDSGSPMASYYPITVECYNADGGLLGTVKPATTSYNETTTLGKSTTAKLHSGTAKITIKVYTTQGSVYLHGLSNFEK